MSTRNYTLLCLSETLSPATHMSRSEGNESIVARETVMTATGERQVPVLSGNAIRHRCVREPGARWLIEEYGLAGKLTLPQLNFLFHGGNLTEGGGRENMARIAAMQHLWPLLRLLGGCLPNQVIYSSLQVWRGTLVCEENRGYLEAVLPDPSLLPGRLRPAESFVSGYQYTRGDARKTVPELATHASLASTDSEDAAKESTADDSNEGKGRSKTKEKDSNLMIFAGQVVTRGAVFVHGFTLPHVGLVELGALLWSLRLWRAAGGTVGGQAARGHGRLATAILHGCPDAAEAEQAYVEHARSVRDEAVAWLHDVFAPRAEKPARLKKGKAAKTEEPVTDRNRNPSLLGEG